ncbi:pentatricopeptide repeat protein-like protein [Lindgomyces ingoldianus]|uniref:Pentatricopeptide repeat protein-like protein n=1 Tax=Lindgomyces ingoldianus TaxID=673940 RepID=A0ACB6R258_9PLEO|nr:pentatricopeptide repeat protein-like protein [Lindgomyces ingoldianus]KAF2473338.1 pentatricopeptide repeat protein-like protein [Lindgomyces ingoldianus]
MRTEARSSIRRVAGRPEYVPGADKLAGRKEDPWKKSTQAAGLKKKERKGLTRQPAPTKQINRIGVQVSRKVGRRDPSISSKDWRSRKMELQYITDPLELADFVKKELNKDKTAEMLQLVRMASNSMQCIVSWNHIIDYYLIKGWVSRAVKIYNEMKKRAQFPDAYTYTILLRGLAANAHESGAMEKALSIYHSLSTPNSRVQPSIIHTNAMLKVCARAANMDALWGVAAKVPENGPGAATPVTFVTILNAIRQSLLVNVPVGETEEQVARRREEGIMQGRRIWEDVIGKWRNADLVIEEELVCAMGRLLLIGTRPRDWDDVLSLVEQTMDIPRLVPRLGSPARKQSGVPNLRAPNVPEEYRVEHHHLGPSNEPPRGGEFLPIVARGIGSAVSNPLSYATPSNSTLSLVQEACQKIVGKKAGDEYWNLLTDPTTYGIVPDVNNIHQRLRILRQSRASGEAVELLDSFILAKEKPSPGTFRIAMSTCGRDKNNHNSLKYASQILETMKTTLEDADAKTVTMYAKLAIDFPLAKGTDLLEALARLNPIVRDLRLQLGIGRERKDGLGVRATLLTGQGREDAIEALKKIHGLFDRLINSNMIAEEQKRSLRIEKARLSAYLNKLIFKSSSRQDMKPDIGDDEVAPDFKDTKDDGDKERGGFKGLINGTGAWRKRNALPEGQRKPWFSPAERSTA